MAASLDVPSEHVPHWPLLLCNGLNSTSNVAGQFPLDLQSSQRVSAESSRKNERTKIPIFKVE